MTIAEINKETSQATGTLYQVNTCGELTAFNRSFDYTKFYASVGGKNYYNMKSLTTAVKEIIG